MKQLFSPAEDSSSGPWMREYRHENCHMCDVYWWSWNQVQISQLLLTQLFHFFLLTRAVLKSESRFVNPYKFRFRWLDTNKWRRWWWHDRSHHCKQGQSICNAFFDWWMLATEVWCSGTNCNAFFSHNNIIHSKWIRSHYIFVSSFIFFFFNLCENKLWIVTKYTAGTSQSSIFMTHFLSARRMRADIFDKGLWRKHRIWKKIKVCSFMLNNSIAFYMIEKWVKFKVAS